MSSSEPSSQTDVLTQIFQGIKNKNLETRLQAAKDLKKYVQNTITELSSDSAAKLWEDNINRRLLDLAHSSQTTDHIGCLLAIEHLLSISTLDSPTESFSLESKRIVHRFYYYVKGLLPNSDLGVMLMAAQVLGMVIAKAGPLFDARMIDYEIPNAIDLLQSLPSHSHSHSSHHSSSSAQEWNRFAAILILHAWAMNNPGLFRTHINLVLEKLLVAMKDGRVVVREACAELMAACLDVVSGRERVVVSSSSVFNSSTTFSGFDGSARDREKSFGPSDGTGTRAPTPAFGSSGRDGRGAAILIRILADAQTGLKAGSVESIHGALLTYRELLLHGGMFMKDTFDDAAEMILKYRLHKDPLIRRTVITLIPSLATYDTQSFSEHFMHRSMAHLLEMLGRVGERAYAFIAIGHVATAVGSDIKSFLDTILEQIKIGLQQLRSSQSSSQSHSGTYTAIASAYPYQSSIPLSSSQLKKLDKENKNFKSSLPIPSSSSSFLLPSSASSSTILPSLALSEKFTSAPPEEPIFQCIALLAAAVGPNLTKLLHDQLDLMFACGLSEGLRMALVAIARYIPPLLKTIQDRLLDLISIILSGQNYRPLGAPPHYTSMIRASETINNGVRDIAIQQGEAAKTPELITLALNTLGSFDFSGHILNEFIHNSALPYLEDDHAEVRKAAALTCCKLFVHDPICHQSSNRAIEIISDVLDKLLTVGIADPDPVIRQTVLSSLDERFDKHLSQAENVRSLFIALNDEVFQNRILATKLIGRLATYNPAYVMSSLRKALIQLMTEMQYSTVTKGREECTRLLTLLVSSTQRLIKPYTHSMLSSLLPFASDPNATVCGNVLMCLGELTCVGGEEVSSFVPSLMTVILKCLADPSVIKRDAALHALGQVCSSTGYVVQPFVDHPQLLGLLGKILRTEQNPPIRREVIKVLGILGAIDPYRRKSRAEIKATNEAAAPVNVVPITTGTIVATDDYYQTVVIDALLSVLRDQSLNVHHHTVIEAIMSIFKTQGLKCVAFLPAILPAFINVTRSAAAARFQEFHLQQLAILVGIIKYHIHPYTIQIFSLVTELWDNPALQLPIVTLVEALGKALDAEFKAFLPAVLPLTLKVFEGELDDKRQNIQIKILDAYLTFAANIEEYLHLVIPVVVKSYERPDASNELRKRAILTIDGLIKRVNFSDHASRIIHPMIRVLPTSSHDLKVAILDTLCSLVLQLGPDFAIFVPTINKCLLKNKISHSRYENLIAKLLAGERLSQDVGILDNIRRETAAAADISNPAESPKMTVNQQHLKQAWDISQVVTRDDWNEWIHRFCVELMKESSSHALRACMSLVDIHPPLARELFNAAFLSCWNELYDQYQEDLVRCIEHAITSPTTPTELTHRLLNLAEFMEHEDKPLPIENHTLGEYALKNFAYAKALHYKELEFFSNSSPALIEDLIRINTKLQQHDAANGTLQVAREQYDVTKHEEWYERLGRWQDALGTYDRKLESDPDSPGAVMGKLRCLFALGEWEPLASTIQQNWPSATNDERLDMAPMAAAAAWSLDDWDSMDDYIATMRGDSPDRSFYKAILAVHRNQFPKALAHIAKARDMLDPELTPLVGENYGRTYNIMVRAQMLSELEEIIQFKQNADQPERQATTRKTWMKRLQGCQPEVEVWQRIIQVRTLVLQPTDDPAMWIKFANLCRKSERMQLADKTINSLLEAPTYHFRGNQNIKAPPNVVYAQLKFMWANGSKGDAFQHLHDFTKKLSLDLQKETPERSGRATVSTEKLSEISHLLARCYYKQGAWQSERKQGWDQESIKDILDAYYWATYYDPEWYKAWHTWALTNNEVVNHLQTPGHTQIDDIEGRQLMKVIIQAVEGFFRSISLANENALQDTLRLLTLWFKFGSHEDVSHAMARGFESVNIDTWLEVIPQIIARIQTPSANIRRTIDMLLINIGKHHPQALIYPLTVASKSPSASRKEAATVIMNRMKEHSAKLVDQALLVSEELIRVAILWHELWHEGLEEASRAYYNDKNPDGMVEILEPLHDMIEAGPKTSRETTFMQVFGRDLGEAREAIRRYRKTNAQEELDKAWSIYYTVFKRVEKQMPQLTILDLQFVSPELLNARNLELAVPGTYHSGRPIVTIQSFANKLTVISSKQRPRRLSVKGSDGRDYQYLLKGHEDLRQDERVMQLFSLVNTLLSVDTDSFKRRLDIQRYPVIPLAPNAGLLGWVQESDTLHVLVRDYRDSRKILLNIEYRLMLQMAPDYETLTLLQKVEVFEYALDNTTGQDLYRVLWLKSRSSEHWLERRATYTRSLAVNSMVGHILGLGDRHPSNLLLERNTGKVVHIDFGDCFEVAMLREKFPEKVPFRLTRMLTHAMEVSGIQGSFQKTCEITMRVLRGNKESLLAVLEAFVYDPLINWRLLQPEVDRRPHGGQVRPDHLAKVSGYPQGPSRKLKADEKDIFNENYGERGTKQEVRNERALSVYNRVQNKLTGRDFNPDVALDIPSQVSKLISQATSLENLCQCFSGWCAFW